MEFGPIQLVVIGFDDIKHFEGRIAEELDAIRSRGVIRLVDALAVVKDANGDVLAIEASDFSGDEMNEIGTAIRKLLGMDEEEAVAAAKPDDMIAAGIGITQEDIAEAANELEPGRAVLYLLIEHTWAIGLKHAVRGAGGYPIVQGFLTPEVVMMVGAELEAILEAERTIELAEAVKGAAILDALITTEVAREAAAEVVIEAAAIAAAAVDETEAIVEEMEAIRTAAAAETVRALIVAEMIEEAAAQEAAEALVAAGLIKAAALEAAAESAGRTEAELAAMD